MIDASLRRLSTSLMFLFLFLFVVATKQHLMAGDKDMGGAPQGTPASASEGTKESGSEPEADPTRYKIFTNSVGMKMVLIPGGEFTMGSDTGGSDERPPHKVFVNAFYMGATEVTQGQWEALMGNNPSRFRGDPELPVEKISWEDAQEFVRKLNAKEGTDSYRLPTEAEWEYACRAGSEGKFSFGDSEEELDRYAWYKDTSVREAHPVAGKRPNSWGLYDMHGNVWEWVNDWYSKDYYKESPGANPKGPLSGVFRVLKGGSWENAEWHQRCAARYGSGPQVRSGHSGLRVVRSLRPSKEAKP